MEQRPDDIAFGAERVMDLRDVWSIQIAQQRNWHDWERLTVDERDLLTRDLILGMQEEVAELQRRLLDRYHLPKTDRTTNVLTVAEEGADVFKYVVALLALHGVDAETFGEAFVRKTRVVNQRWAWQSMALGPGLRVLLCDLDGVVADWEKGFRGFAELRGRPIPMGKLNDPELEPLKDEFDGGGGFVGLEPMPGAIEALAEVRRSGVQVIIVTSRPYERHRRVYADTIEWCRRHRLTIDQVFFERDKARVIHTLRPATIIGFVEDRTKHALEVALAGVRVFKLPSEGDEHVEHPRVVLVDGWGDILGALRKGGDM